MAISENGNVSIIGILLMLVISSLLIIGIYHHKKTLVKIQQKYQFYLCAKKFDSRIKKTIKKVEVINYFLKTGKVVGFLSYIPYFSGIKVVTKILIKAAIRLQDYLLVSYQKNIMNEFRKSCPLPICSGILTSLPYEHMFIKFKRKGDGPAKLIRKKWTCILKKNTDILKVNFSLQNLKLQSSFRAMEMLF